MKRDNNNNHRIVKSISAMFILVAPVADCIIDWISDNA